MAAEARLLVRILLVLSILLLAGCTTPEEPVEDPLFGVCPQWVEDGTSSTWSGGAGSYNLSSEQSYQGFPVDRFRFEVAGTGSLEARFFGSDGGERHSVVVYRSETPVNRPFLGINNESLEAVVFLAPVAGETAPQGLRIDVTGDGAATWAAYPAFRVCGI